MAKARIKKAIGNGGALLPVLERNLKS